MSPSRITASLRRLLGFTATSPVKAPMRRRSANRFRPLLECFEDRTVPSVVGNVFYDLNANGTKDTGETGAVNAEINLFQNGMWAGVTHTDSSGNYSFSATPTGADVVEVLPIYNVFAYTLSTPVDGNGRGVVTSGVGNVGLVGQGAEAGGWGTIKGTIWYDWDEDGVRDAGEAPVIGGGINLYTDGEFVTGVSSDSNGEYEFTGLWGGDYVVEWSTPYTNFVATTPVDVGGAEGGSVYATVTDATPIIVDFGLAGVGYGGEMTAVGQLRERCGWTLTRTG